CGLAQLARFRDAPDRDERFTDVRVVDQRDARIVRTLGECTGRGRDVVEAVAATVPDRKEQQAAPGLLSQHLVATRHRASPDLTDQWNGLVHCSERQVSPGELVGDVVDQRSPAEDASAEEQLPRAGGELGEPAEVLQSLEL